MSETTPEILSGEYAPSKPSIPKTIRIVDWNIDRGLNFDGILNFLRGANADVVLLQEVDLHDRRTKLRNVADEIAKALKLNYVWGREFQELVQGASSSPAYQGQATFSRWAIRNPRILRFQHQSGFWHQHWFVPHVAPFQVRVGGRIALACDLDLGTQKLVTYNLHLESRNTDRLRVTQLKEMLADVSRYNSRSPILMAGDFNMNVTHQAAAAELQRAEFRPVLPGGRSTTHFLSIGGPALDWVFVRGPVQASGARIHSSVHASDHYPISFDLSA
jgi:endonuclease/exonuclease/phosphatase family metal-dependent hydrolase